jgi:hypothetical protein
MYHHTRLREPILSPRLLIDAGMDYQDWAIRQNQSTEEFIWRSSKNFGAAAQTFTGLLFWGYGPPDWSYCFDWDCSSAIPIQDDVNLEDYNVQGVYPACESSTALL